MFSQIQNLNITAKLPMFSNRGILYMHKTSMNRITLPDKFKEYENTIHQVTYTLRDQSLPIYVTIDEKRVRGTHRRPGAHVDFNWYEAISSNSKDRHRHRPPEPEPEPEPEPKPTGRHGGHRAIFDTAGGMLLLSNYEGCRGWNGRFDEQLIGDGGSCEAFSLEDLESQMLKANNVYYVNPLGIHESVKISGEVDRSLIRINFHPRYVFN